MTEQETKRAEWVAALRSGKYAQGTRALRRPDHTYCCLGVLCDVLDNSRWLPSQGYNSVPYAAAADDDQSATFPPREFIRKVGLSFANACKLARQNDKGADFDHIADLIENMPFCTPNDN